MKPIIWDEAKAKQELATRFREASDYRSRFEGFWERNEQLMFDVDGGISSAPTNVAPEHGVFQYNSGLNTAQINQNSAYAFKNLRFIHSQMSSNPPTVLAEPTTSDPDDRLVASAADRLVTHGRQTYQLADHIDKLTLATLVYGTGCLKLVWDSTKGEIVDVTEDGEMVLEGDLTIKTPSIWDLYIDQHAEDINEIRYVFQRITMSTEEAVGRWPEHKEEIEQSSSTDNSNEYAQSKPGREIELYEYWEKGLPENGYDGRYALHLEDGTVLGQVKSNPHRFLAAETIRSITKKYKDLGEDIVEAMINKIPQKAELPFHFLTDIDVPQTVYGKSTLDYVGPIQMNLNRLMLTALDNAAAHGAVQLILPAGSEIADDSLVNVPYNVIKISGQVGPHPLHMPTLLGDLGPLMDREKQQIDDLMGVNESMFGQMNRETANATLQSASANGSQIRRRLFNKYTKTVEDIYTQFLKLFRKHVETDRLYHIIGKEHPLEALEIKTMDLDGGYDLKVSYGTSFSLDPATRKAEILQMLPFLKEAKLSPSVILELSGQSELRGLVDKSKAPKERQLEIIDEMLETQQYIPPEENQNHIDMLAASLDYVMTREFFDLDDNSKLLINQHINDRKQMAANEMNTGQAAVAPPMPPPM
jgi:hypothetical protein